MYQFPWSRALKRHRLQASRKQRRARRRFPLGLEPLEDRITPSTTTAANATELATVIQQDNLSNTADTILLTGGVNDYQMPDQLKITDTAGLTIQGQGQAIDAGGSHRAFLIDAGSANIVFQNLTIQNGYATDDGTGGSGTAAEGGGILDLGGNVTLSHVTLQDNQVGYNEEESFPTAAGGGIYVGDKGSLTIQSSVIQSNEVDGADSTTDAGGAVGGGIYSTGPVTIAHSTVSDNIVNGGNSGTFYGGYAQGGGIVALGTAAITDSILTGNTVIGGAGGGGAGGSAVGGGILCQGSLTLSASTVSGNTLTGGSGRVLAGDNAVFFDIGGDVIGGGVAIASNSTVTISNSILSYNTLTGGQGIDSGSGTVQNSVGGSAVGGGLYVYGSSSVTLTASTLSGNIVTGGGGSGGPATPGSAQGGGAYFKSSGIQLINSTIADNQAIGGKSASANSISEGGGLYFDSTSTATLTNVTLAGNKARLPQDSSGITIGGGIDNSNATPQAVTLLNTLVAGNNADTGPDYSGTVSAGSGHNLIGNADDSSGFSTARGDLLGTTANPLDPHLGPLADNGGPTPTMALLSGSPAIDAGDNSAQSVTGSYDQRDQGFARVVNGAIDIGAFEVQTQQQNATTTTITTPSVSTTYNSTIPQTVTLSASVAAGNGGPVNEGAVTFTLAGTSLTATGIVTGGTATATLTLPASLAAGNYSFAASYADAGSTLYGPSTAAAAGTLAIHSATVTTTPLTITNAIDPFHPVVTLAANVTSADGGTVSEGTVTFTIINPKGTNLTGTANVSQGVATTTLTMPRSFAAGTYVYIASYTDSNNVNGVANYAAISGAATVDPPGGSTATLTVGGSPPDSSPATPPVSGPVGSLSLFALGLGPTGIDWFEVDSQGDIFAQGLFGGGLVLVSSSPHLPSVVMSNDGLMALLAGDNGQNYFLDLFDPLLPLIEPAVLAALKL